MNDLLRAFDLLDNLRSLLPCPGVATIGSAHGFADMLDLNWQWRMPDGRWLHYKRVVDRTLLLHCHSEWVEHEMSEWKKQMQFAFANPPPDEQVVE